MNPTADQQIKVAYFVQELEDSAVRRRVMMLESGGAAVTVLGFSRTKKAPSHISNAPVTCLGYTTPGAFVSRIKSIIFAIIKHSAWKRAMSGADVVIARNLESLAVAAFGCRFSKPHPLLYYELLDVHRLLLRGDALGSAIRTVERKLLHACCGVIVSSPAFFEKYIKPNHPLHPKILLLENKVFITEQISKPPYDHRSTTAAAAGVERAIRIGWFGIIRCKRSLEILKELVLKHPGRFELVIRGRIAETAIPNFFVDIKDAAGIQYLGPYKSPEDLANIYAAVDIAWMVDFYEEGMNSNWLLPNRLYEGSLYGAVGITLQNVQTGLWLAERNAGITLASAHNRDIVDEVSRFSLSEVSEFRGRLMNMDSSNFLIRKQDCLDLVAWLLPRDAEPNCIANEAATNEAIAQRAEII